MSKKTTKSRVPGSKAPFQVKPVMATEVAAIILEELSRHYGSNCNYLDAATLVRRGEIYLGLTAIEQQHHARGAVSSPRDWWVRAQALAAVKKLVDPALDRWPLTKESWFRTEERCRKLNLKFTALRNRRERGEKPLPMEYELQRFYKGLHYVLGDTPPLDDITEEAYYGPGSTVSIRGRDVHYARKVEAEECVPQAVELAARALVHDRAAWAHIGMDPHYSYNEDAREGFIRVMRERLQGKVVTHDRLMFIHKNIEVMRSIGAQPTCSGMLQLGVHTVVSNLLLKVGVDLRDQHKNQHLAYLGSKDWTSSNPICTLDKKDASNLIALMVPMLFFPPAWAKLLGRIRTPGYEAPPELGGGKHSYHMYAGMGNGTTFCVETLIFWAASFATSKYGSVEGYVKSGTFAVYGDDVILLRDHAKRYMRLAKFLGFRFNAKKTFLDGPFRESCGADFYDGVPVRPATVDSETPNLEMLDLIGIHNTLADNRTFPLDGACEKIRRLWATRIRPQIPTDPQGNLGFRPINCAHYTLVETGQVVSDWWQRPRCYIVEAKPQYADLGNLDPWTQIAVALLRGRQSAESADRWSLPARASLVKTQVKPEQDLRRKDLVLMLRNQLERLADRKAQPWWDDHRGNVAK